MTDLVRIASPALTVEIDPLGAELARIVDAAGRDWLWNGDPAFWTGRAPLLFPIVGALNGGLYRHAGREHRLDKHGFARRSRFDLVAQDEASATFRLMASEATRDAYPFAFRLDMRFAVDGATLVMEAIVANDGAEPMPASFGYHPALVWPLPEGGSKTDHVVRFAKTEDAPVRGVTADGLIDGAELNPVVDRTIHLHDALFANDALVFDRLESRALWYGVPGRPGIAVGFDLPMLGLWTKPGAGYLCIEPWQGHADPAGYDGELAGKPGMLLIAPGDAHRFTMTLTIGADEPDFAD